MLPDVIINFTVEIWEENNDIYELKVYREFIYSYQSRNQPINTVSSVITYNNLNAAGSGKVDFKFKLAKTITGTDPEEKVVWTLAGSNPL